MIIGIDGSRAFIKEKTGTENYSFQLLKHLAKIDRDDTFLIYIRPGVEVSKKEWPDNFSFRVINYPRFWTQMGLAFKTFKDPLDVLFVPSHTLPLIRKKGLKTVMTVHDLGAEYLPKAHQLKQRLYLGFITNVQLKSATKLIAVSKATKEDLITKVGVIEERVAVVHEAVDTNTIKVPNSIVVRNVLKHFDIEKNNYFFFVGSIQPRKNLTRLIEAYNDFLRDSSTVKNIPDLVLAGGKGWLSEEIYELPQKLGIEERVRFIGRVSDQELSALLSGSIGLVFPSLFEGFGLPILEAFSCNTPVLTSNISSMPEVAGDAAILVDPYNKESIVKGLKSLQNSKERERLIKLGKIQLKKFSWEKAAKETLKVLQGTKNER